MAACHLADVYLGGYFSKFCSASNVYHSLHSPEWYFDCWKIVDFKCHFFKHIKYVLTFTKIFVNMQRIFSLHEELCFSILTKNQFREQCFCSSPGTQSSYMVAPTFFRRGTNDFREIAGLFRLKIACSLQIPAAINAVSY